MTGLKTNKSFSKRLRVTKHGTILARQPNQNHFRAKKSRKTELHTNRWGTFVLHPKKQGHYMPLA